MTPTTPAATAVSGITHRLVWSRPQAYLRDLGGYEVEATGARCVLLSISTAPRAWDADDEIDGDGWEIWDEAGRGYLQGGGPDLPRSWPISNDSAGNEDMTAQELIETEPLWKSVENRILQRNNLSRESVTIELPD